MKQGLSRATPCRFILAATICLFVDEAVAAEIWSWDVEDAADTYGASEGTALEPGGANSAFESINSFAGIGVEYTQSIARGQWAIRLTYPPPDEAGTQLHVPFHGISTPNMYLRWYEHFSTTWSGDWPKGLKLGRWFTDGAAYLSDKLWTRACGQSDFFTKANFAILNADIMFHLDDTTFGDGLPGVGAGRWYKLEIWLELGTAVVASPDTYNDYCVDVECSNNVAGNDSCDGVLRVWIDDVLVLDHNRVCWRRTAHGVPDGFNWQSGWFGGNYSGSSCGDASETLIRYLDDLYVSTTLDRIAPTRPESPKNLRVVE